MIWLDEGAISQHLFIVLITSDGVPISNRLSSPMGRRDESATWCDIDFSRSENPCASRILHSSGEWLVWWFHQCSVRRKNTDDKNKQLLVCVAFAKYHRDKPIFLLLKVQRSVMMLQHACVISLRLSLPCYVEWPRHVAHQILLWLLTKNSSSVILFHTFF